MNFRGTAYTHYLNIYFIIKYTMFSLVGPIIAATKLLTLVVLLKSTLAALSGGCFSKIDPADVTDSNRYKAAQWDSSHIILKEEKY